jgi:hypothetical protein
MLKTILAKLTNRKKKKESPVAEPREQERFYLVGENAFTLEHKGEPIVVWERLGEGHIKSQYHEVSVTDYSSTLFRCFNDDAPYARPELIGVTETKHFSHGDRYIVDAKYRFEEWKVNVVELGVGMREGYDADCIWPEMLIEFPRNGMACLTNSKAIIYLKPENGRIKVEKWRCNTTLFCGWKSPDGSYWFTLDYVCYFVLRIVEQRLELVRIIRYD